MTRPTALVTGATSGLGEALSWSLVQAGYRVVVHGRDPASVDALVGRIGEQAAGATADLADLEQVRWLAEEPVDLLINNAAVASRAPGSIGSQGYDLMFQVNHLAAALLTRLLLPGIRQRGGKVVSVVSRSQQALSFAEYEQPALLDDRTAYARSKLALVTDTLILAEGNCGTVHLKAIHPASLMNTRMVRQAGVSPRSTVAEGCANVMDAVLDPLPVVSGCYLDEKQPRAPHQQALDPVARERQAELTARLLSPWWRPDEE